MADDRVLLLNMLRSQVLAMQCQLDTAMALIDALAVDSPFTVTGAKESAAESAIPEAMGPVNERESSPAAPGLDLPRVFGGQPAGTPRAPVRTTSGGGDAPETFTMPLAGPDGVIGDDSPAQ